MQTKTISAKQLEANRANAKLSTGPRTYDGKMTSSHNAVRTGLTGRTILLSPEEADAYEHLLTRLACEYNPVGEKELELVQRLADTQWRLNRIPVLEAGIYAQGRLQFSADYAFHEPGTGPILVETQTFLTYRRDLTNLSIQETRLRRNFDKDSAALASLQAQRREAEQAAAQAAAPKPQTAAEPENGFEFSTAAAAGAAPALLTPEPVLNPPTNLRSAPSASGSAHS